MSSVCVQDNTRSKTWFHQLLFFYSLKLFLHDDDVNFDCASVIYLVFNHVRISSSRSRSAQGNNVHTHTWWLNDRNPRVIHYSLSLSLPLLYVCVLQNVIEGWAHECPFIIHCVDQSSSKVVSPDTPIELAPCNYCTVSPAISRVCDGRWLDCLSTLSKTPPAVREHSLLAFSSPHWPSDVQKSHWGKAEAD